MPHTREHLHQLRETGSRITRFHHAVRFAFPQRFAVAVILVLTLAVSGLNAVEPLILKYIFDGLVEEDAVRALVTGLVGLGLFALGREALSAGSNWLTWHTRIGLHYALLDATVGKLHRMPLHIQRSEGVGAIMTRLDRSIQGLVAAVAEILFNVIPALVFLVISAIIMFNLNATLATVVLLFAPLPALIATLAAPEQTARERILLDRWAKIYGRFNEVLSGILVVRSFTMEDEEKRRFMRDVDSANRVVIRGVGLDQGYSAASNIVVAIARIAAIGVGGWMVINGAVTVGTVVAFLGYVGQLFGPVQGLSGVYQTVKRATVCLDEILGILNVQEHLGDRPDAVDPEHINGEVEFRNISFRYNDDSRLVLKDFSLKVEAGKMVAIIGPSGSGKSTLMGLLMRFYEAEEGTIFIDGQDIRNLKQSGLRRHIAVVLQDPLLFNDTVRNNIAYGKPDASEREIEAAAKAANAYDLIEHLSEGFDTRVGERGTLLSVGERQRITIARALLKNPSILILDEATSALDAESEQLVQQALENLEAGRTTFVIAHRLSTVVNADRIVVLGNGRVTESGTHEELMELNGYYADLIRRQHHGLIDNDVPSPAVDRRRNRRPEPPPESL
ncbi:ABC transporter ATP-binding protein [Gilvimarinus sp. F26214L]|uniref:ABC transporter ATP-binding protein n=1 Tax=Gilvimarinus sp. DZF01 TaxID=3461371 RepID=UPI004045BA26